MPLHALADPDTWWNTIAFFELAHAIMVADVGVDLFHYATADNRSLRGSLDFIAPWTSANPPGYNGFDIISTLFSPHAFTYAGTISPMYSAGSRGLRRAA